MIPLMVDALIALTKLTDRGLSAITDVRLRVTSPVPVVDAQPAGAGDSPVSAAGTGGHLDGDAAGCQRDTQDCMTPGAHPEPLHWGPDGAMECVEFWKSQADLVARQLEQAIDIGGWLLAEACYEARTNASYNTEALEAIAIGRWLIAEARWELVARREIAANLRTELDQARAGQPRRY